MPTDLYVYLRGGRGDALLTAVTETPEVVTKTVVSAPYRDLGHRGSTATGNDGLDIVELTQPIGSEMVFAPGNRSVGGSSSAVPTGVNTGTGNTKGQVISAPDNVTHVPPRQVDLLVSYWSFTCSDGIDKFFPVDDVIGWGPTART
jgi:hypothetical protein